MMKYGYIIILILIVACGNQKKFPNLLREPSPLMIAIYESDVDKAKKLIEEGANTKATFGGTPLIGFVRNGEMVDMLIEKGFDKNFIKKSNGKNLLAIVVGNRINGKVNPAEISCIKALIKHGLDVNNHKTDTGKTIAMGVVKGYPDEDCVDILKLLKSSGADFSLKDNNDRTLFSHALKRRKKNEKIIRYLKSIGLEDNISKKK